MIEQNIASSDKQKQESVIRTNTNLTEGNSYGTIKETLKNSPDCHQISVNIFNDQLMRDNDDDSDNNLANGQQLPQQKVKNGSQIQMAPQQFKQRIKGVKTPKNSGQPREEQAELKLKINFSPNDIFMNNNSPAVTLGMQSSMMEKTKSSKQGARDEFNISDISIQKGFPAITSNEGKKFDVGEAKLQVQKRSGFRQRARGSLGPHKIPNITGFSNLPKAKKTPVTNISNSAISKMSPGLQKAFDHFQLPQELKPSLTKRYQKQDMQLGMTQITRGGFDEIESSLASKRNDTNNDQYSLESAQRSAHAFFSPQNQSLRNQKINHQNKDVLSQTLGAFFPASLEQKMILQYPQVKTPFANLRQDKNSLQREMMEFEPTQYQAHSSIHPINSNNVQSRSESKDEVNPFSQQITVMKDTGSNTMTPTANNSLMGRRYTTQVETQKSKQFSLAANHDLQQIKLRVFKNQGKRANSNARNPVVTPNRFLNSHQFMPNTSTDRAQIDKTSDPALGAAIHQKSSPRNFHESVITHLRKKALIQRQMSPYRTFNIGHNMFAGAASNPGIQPQMISQIPEGKLNFKKLLSSTLQNIANTSQTSINKASPKSSLGESELLAGDNSGSINISPAPILTFNTNQQSKIKIVKDIPTEWSARNSMAGNSHENSNSPSHKLLLYSSNLTNSQSPHDIQLMGNQQNNTEESPAKHPELPEDGSAIQQKEDSSSLHDAMSNIQPAKFGGRTLATPAQMAGLADVSQQISIQDLNNEEFTNQLQQYNEKNLPQSLQQSQQRQKEQQKSSLFGQTEKLKQSTLMTHKIQKSDSKGDQVGQMTMDERSKSLDSYASINSKESPVSVDKKRKSKMSPGVHQRKPSKIELNRQDTVSGKVSDQLIQLKLLDHQASTTQQQQQKTSFKVFKAFKGKKLRKSSKESREQSSRMSKQEVDITRLAEEYGPQNLTSREHTSQTLQMGSQRNKSKGKKGSGEESSPAPTREQQNIIKHYEETISKSIEEEDYVSKTFSKTRKRNDSSNEDIKEVMDIKEKMISPQFGNPGFSTLLTPPTPSSAMPQRSPKNKLQLETSNLDIIDSLYVESPQQMKSPKKGLMKVSDAGIKSQLSKMSQLSPLSFKRSPKVTIKQEIKNAKSPKRSRSPQQYQCIPIKVWDCKNISNASKIQMKQYSRRATPVESNQNSKTPNVRRKHQPLQFPNGDPRKDQLASFERKQAPKDGLFVIEDEEKTSQVLLSKVDPASEEKHKQDSKQEQIQKLQNDKTMSFENIAIRRQVGPNVRESIPLLSTNKKQRENQVENNKSKASEEISPQSQLEDQNFNSDYIIEGMDFQNKRNEEFALNSSLNPQQTPQKYQFNTNSILTNNGQNSQNNRTINGTNIMNIFELALPVNTNIVQIQSQRPFQDNFDTSATLRQSSKQQSQMRVPTNPTIVNMNSDILPVQNNSKMTEDSSLASIAQTPAGQLRFPKSKLKNQRGSPLTNKIHLADSSEIIPVGLIQGTHGTDQSQTSMQFNQQQSQIYVKPLMVQQQSNRKNFMYGSENPSDKNFATTPNDIMMAPAVVLGTMSQSKARSPPKLPVAIQQNIKIKPQILNEGEIQSQKKHQGIKVIGKKAKQIIQQQPQNTSKQKQIIDSKDDVSKDESAEGQQKMQEFGNNTQGSQDYFMHLEADSQMAVYDDLTDFKMASLQHENGELTQTMTTKNIKQTNSRALDIEKEEIELEFKSTRGIQGLRIPQKSPSQLRSRSKLQIKTVLKRGRSSLRRK